MKFLDSTGLTYLWGKIAAAFQAKITASGVLKGDGQGGVTAATAGTDFQGVITASGILKGNGSGGVSAATAGTDFAAVSHSHGDITATAAIASGDRIVINDESASKITNSSITFGTATTTFLRNDGTWNSPTGTTYAAASVPNNTSICTNGSAKAVYDATKHTTLTVSLTAAGWNSSTFQQSVTASGVTASNLVFVSPAPASWLSSSASGIYCSAQASNSLTFTCSIIPSAAITMNVVIMS